MKRVDAQSSFSKDEIIQSIIGILEDMTADWDMGFTGAIGPETKIVADLQFESIDVVQLVVAIEEQFKQRKFPFEELLMKDGRYVDEITVNSTADFLCQHLNSHE